MPVVLLGTTEDSQILLKSLIGSLTSSICLRVICCADVLMDVQKAAKICSKFRRKVDITVRYDFVGNAVVRSHVGGIERGHSLRVYGLVTWEKYGRL